MLHLFHLGPLRLLGRASYVLAGVDEQGGFSEPLIAQDLQAAVADLATPTATGTFTFTAANGDQLLVTFVGNAANTIEPGVVSFTETLTIVGGTGRFAGAIGTFTMRRIAHIDFATGTSTSTGSFEGHITLND